MKIDAGELAKAFQDLMGINGDRYIDEIITKGFLSESSYNAVCKNVQYNSKDSIVKHFGLVHYYYLQGTK